MITLSLLMTLSMLSTSADAGVRTASPSPPAGAKADREVVLRIESKALLEQQVADAVEDTTYFVRTDSTKALREQHGARAVDGGTGPAIVVQLSWVSYADSIYGVKIETMQPGKAPKLVETFECECSDSELTAAVIARLPAALEQLEEREAAAVEPPVEPEGPSSTTGEPTEPTDDLPRKPLGTLGKAGVGVGAVGASVLIGGGIVYSRGTRYDPPTGQLEERNGRDFKPLGVALMVSGGAVLVTGAVLLIVDRTRPRKKEATALLLPSPHGLVLTGRF